jgi:hypothetical protein
MYLDNSGTPAASTAGSGFTVDPAQVKQFAAAVAQVRADLNRISTEVDNMSTPNYAPLLGTSPVGQELAEKFTDRMGSDYGLRGQLQLALQHMEEFVRSAELAAASYDGMNQDHADNMRYS